MMETSERRAVEASGKNLAMRPKDPDARTDLGISYSNTCGDKWD